LTGLAALALTLTGCSSVVPGRSPALHVDEADRDLIGRWSDASGRELEDGSNGILVIRSQAGSTTCGEDHVTVFLELAWPVGRKIDVNQGITEEMVPRFVRDTTGALLRFDGGSDLDTDLPGSARPTGFFLNGNTIHASPDGRAVYVTRTTQRVERWPRLKPDPVCAG
jgi:hypothetical protein